MYVITEVPGGINTMIWKKVQGGGGGAAPPFGPGPGNMHYQKRTKEMDNSQFQNIDVSN